jgi:hypothetical protein
MGGLVGIFDALGGAALSIFVGARGKVSGDRASFLRTVIGGAIVGVTLGLITYPIAPSTLPTLFSYRAVTFTDWLGDTAVAGCTLSLVSFFLDYWLAGKDFKDLK